MSLKAAGGSPRPTPAAGCRASGCRKKAAASWLVFPSVISRVRLVEVQVLIDDALVVNVLLDGGVSTVMHLLHGVVNVVLGVMANLLHALVRLLQEDLGIVIVLRVFGGGGLGRCRRGLGRLARLRRLRLALGRHHGRGLGSFALSFSLSIAIRCGCLVGVA